MADINKLALSAKAKLEKGDAINEADAISKAIRSVGITHPGDHKRLMRVVGRQFAQNKRDEAHFAQRRA